MKKVMIFLALMIVICGIVIVWKTGVNLESKQENLVSEVKETVNMFTDNLTNLSQNADKGQINQIISFLDEKSKEGALNDPEGIKQSILEGKEKFQINISEDTAQKIAGALDNLEDLGFSTEDILEKTRETYDRYGSEFADHLEDIFVEATKDAAENAASGFAQSVKETVKDLFS